ncbi:hypothetical protein [Nocardia sp. NPDC005745]|uniref:hypothetical protein n=1 Tax=Nocardia sp. NPDC005745 TaxID=3157061 RepID=UPI0033CB39FA
MSTTPRAATDCPDCRDLIDKYGAPDRSCDTHWQEDHPGSTRTSITFTDVNVNHDTFELLTGVRDFSAYRGGAG